MASLDCKNIEDTVKCEETVVNTAEIQGDGRDTSQSVMEPKQENYSHSTVSPEKSSVENVTENVTEGGNSSSSTTVDVCRACHHLYQSQPRDLVLSPAGLIHASSGLMHGTQGRPHTCYGSFSSAGGQQQAEGQVKGSKPFVPSVAAGRLWSARGYESMCECGEERCQCHTPPLSSLPSRLLPRNQPWWPRLKCGLLVLAAIVPWIFLVAYLVLYYTSH